MRTLETLQKLAQRRLDEVTLEVASATARIAEAREEMEELRRRERAEIAAAMSHPEFYGSLPAFRGRVAEKSRALQTRIDEIEASLQLVRARQADAYREKSKFEQLIETRAIRAAEEEAARDQARLDEAAISRANRT
ncbi:MAG: flagellar FliJ family protein [Hyphomonadaceae bacterium]